MTKFTTPKATSDQSTGIVGDVHGSFDKAHEIIKRLTPVVTKEKLEAAMKEDTPAAKMLTEFVRQASELDCPSSAGFEGPRTFGECGTCAVCLAHEVMDVPH